MIERRMVYQRIGTFKPEEVLPFITSRQKRQGERAADYRKKVGKEYAGHLVKMYSLRYLTFRESGVNCVSCGLSGTYFALEASIPDAEKGLYHFNLYGINEDGEEIMLTKDHIYPKSKGGKDRLSNMQTMCEVCNFEKGDKVSDL